MIRRHKIVVVECFKCGEKGHKCRECPLWKKTKEKRRARRVVKEQAVKYRAKQIGVSWSGVEILRNGWGLTTK